MLELCREMISFCAVLFKQEGSRKWRTAKVVCADLGEETPRILYLRGNQAGAPAWKMAGEETNIIAVLSKMGNYVETDWNLTADLELPQEALESLTDSMGHGWTAATPAEAKARKARLEGRGAAQEELEALRDERARRRLVCNGKLPAVQAAPVAPVAQPRYDMWTAQGLKDELVSWGVTPGADKGANLALCLAGPPPKPASPGKEADGSEAISALETRVAGLESGIAAILAKLG